MSVETGRRCESCGMVRTAGDVRVDGVAKIKSGADQFIVPPLNVKAWKRFTAEGVFKRLREIEEGGRPEESPEWQDAAMQLIHAALRRNYPDLTLDEVEEMVDFGNYGTLLMAIMGRKVLEVAPSPLAPAPPVPVRQEETVVGAVTEGLNGSSQHPSTTSTTPPPGTA